jgi:hypothetical protein
MLERGRRTAGATVVDRTEKQKALLAALPDEASQPEDATDGDDGASDPLPGLLRVRPRAWCWRQDRLMRRALADGIEVAADRIEFALPKVVSRRETAVRSSIHHTSAKIAATLRSYAVDIGLGGAENDQAVPEKIAAALVSLSWGRWDALAIEEPQPAVERFLKRFGPRLAVAAFLVTAAILGPIWLHQWIGEASAQFRIALIAAAVVGLTEAPRTAVDRLATVLAKRQQ